MGFRIKIFPTKPVVNGGSGWELARGIPRFPTRKPWGAKKIFGAKNNG